MTSTKAIVISSIKYSDTSLIVNCYTESDGIKSYLLKGILKSRKGKLKPAYFQPLMQLKVVANHNSKGNLNSLKEVEILHFYEEMHTEIKKQSIAMFLAEVLNGSLKEEEANIHLFQYLETSFLWLDSHHDIANFHLIFLLNLTKFLGFYPELEYNNASYFDLEEGTFTEYFSQTCISGNELVQFRKILGTNFDRISAIKFNSEERQLVLSVLIRYFELHLSGFRKPKSLTILKTVFS